MLRPILLGIMVNRVCKVSGSVQGFHQKGSGLLKQLGSGAEGGAVRPVLLGIMVSRVRGLIQGLDK